MNGLFPLIVLWLWNQRCEPAGGRHWPTSLWPTPASPPPAPPPLPAFQSQRPADADSGTPLSDLHRQQPGPAAVPPNYDDPKAPHTREPAPKRFEITVPRPDSPPTDASPPSDAGPAARGAVKNPPPKLAARAKRPKLAARAKKSTLTSSTPALATSQSAPVVQLQSILIARGARLTKDGLYGPKTAAAWTAAAKQRGLPGTISRVGPKIARVVSRTYDALSVPAIP